MTADRPLNHSTRRPVGRQHGRWDDYQLEPIWRSIGTSPDPGRFTTRMHAFTLQHSTFTESFGDWEIATGLPEGEGDTHMILRSWPSTGGGNEPDIWTGACVLPPRCSVESVRRTDGGVSTTVVYGASKVLQE